MIHLHPTQILLASEGRARPAPRPRVRLFAAVLVIAVSGAWLGPALAQEAAKTTATAETNAPAAAPELAAPVPASAAPAAATAPATGAVSKADNPYGLSSLWAQSDLVAKLVLLLLLIMSMGSWYVIVTKLLEQSRMRAQGRKADADFWKAATVKQGAESLSDNSPFRFVAQAGLDATQRFESIQDRVDFADWIELALHRATERIQRRLSNGMSVLATVGSTSPFVGLFGTVWAIYHALTAIGVAGQASIDKVAGPVGESLIMTAIGLAVAVPAVLGYNWLLRRNASLMDDVRDFGAELQTTLLVSKPKA
jgi:biopolymer transport protein ExbB